MKVQIKYFASLREKAGKSGENLDLPIPTNLIEIYEKLSLLYEFPLTHREIKYSVNNEYVDNQFELKENDVIVFIPPVAGG